VVIALSPSYAARKFRASSAARAGSQPQPRQFYRRRSQDVDVFHDAPELLLAAYEADVAALQKAGFQVEPVGRVQPEFRRALVARDGMQTKIEWVQDAMFRFFPIEPDAELGWRLNFWDAATNKILAMAGRQKIRDFLDTLFLHEQHL
jgi:hypothetical protein